MIRTIPFLAIALALTTTAEARAETKKSIELKTGTPAPQFRLRALDGAMVRLDELAYKGREKKWAKKRPVFLDFFRTDCKPCLKAMPELVQMHKQHSKRGLDIVLVALLEEGPDGKKKLEAYLAKKKLPFKVVVDSNEHIAGKYLGEVPTLPASFLIGRRGTLEQVKYGASGTYQEYFGEKLEKVLSDHEAAVAK